MFGVGDRRLSYFVKRLKTLQPRVNTYQPTSAWHLASLFIFFIAFRENLLLRRDPSLDQSPVIGMTIRIQGLAVKSFINEGLYYLNADWSACGIVSSNVVNNTSVRVSVQEKTIGSIYIIFVSICLNIKFVFFFCLFYA